MWKMMNCKQLHTACCYMKFFLLSFRQGVCYASILFDPENTDVQSWSNRSVWRWNGRRGAFEPYWIPRCNQDDDILLFRQPESRIQRLQELCLVLVDQCHVVIYSIESQEAFHIVHVHSNTSELLHTERGLHPAVPGGEGPSVPLKTPGEVVSRDAAVALVALPVDALVGQTHVCALTADVCLEVVPAQIEALSGQNLAQVLKACR